MRTGLVLCRKGHAGGSQGNGEDHRDAEEPQLRKRRGVCRRPARSLMESRKKTAVWESQVREHIRRRINYRERIGKRESWRRRGEDWNATQ